MTCRLANHHWAMPKAASVQPVPAPRYFPGAQCEALVCIKRAQQTHWSWSTSLLTVMATMVDGRRTSGTILRSRPTGVAQCGLQQPHFIWPGGSTSSGRGRRGRRGGRNGRRMVRGGRPSFWPSRTVSFVLRSFFHSNKWANLTTVYNARFFAAEQTHLAKPTHISWVSGGFKELRVLALKYKTTQSHFRWGIDMWSSSNSAIAPHWWLLRHFYITLPFLAPRSVQRENSCSHCWSPLYRQ